ncbi:hypothetical protein EV178_002889 [Coemansia sp. RSA 1646]|nr:hypothetical protein EV178_002889 [Coemansia sp. RSA 1646]KAJ1771679.1 hypothetical protein LPJ74_002106 [Coemansia sp. RSA 1843]KAJ2214120.1 hypothetical protein EV179_003259 [Coemansia sp. RSA 487]
MIKNNTDPSVSPSVSSQLQMAEPAAAGSESRIQQHTNSAIASLPAVIQEQIRKHAIHTDDRLTQQHFDAHSGFGAHAKSNMGMQRDSGIDTGTASLEALQNYALHAPFLSSSAAGSQMYMGFVDARRDSAALPRPALSSSGEILSQNDIGFIDWCKGLPSSSTAIAPPATGADQHALSSSATAIAAANAIKTSISQRRRQTVPQSGASRTMDLFFNRTEQALDLYSIDRLNKYTVRLFPQVDRGFFLSDNDWTCYRRNYFQVSSTFSMVGASGPVSSPECPCVVVGAADDASSARTVDRFLLGISAQVASSDKGVKLVQHTPKRDKGPQNTPEPQPIHATDSISQSALGISTNSICFERLQFKTATANNGKRRAAQQYYVLTVELLAECDDGSRVSVAHSKSSPIVVRGRSPGHYADGGPGARALSSSTSADAHTLPMAPSLSTSSLSQYGDSSSGTGGLLHGNRPYSGFLPVAGAGANAGSGRESPASASAAAAAAMTAAAMAAATSGYGFSAGDMASAFPGMPPAAMAMAAAMATGGGGGGGNSQHHHHHHQGGEGLPAHTLVQAHSASLDSFGLHGLIPTPSPSIGHMHRHQLHDPSQWPATAHAHAAMPPSVAAATAAAAGPGGSGSSVSSTPLTIDMTSSVPRGANTASSSQNNRHYFTSPPFTSEAATTSDSLFQT